MHRSDFDAGLERIKRTFPKLDDGTIEEVERRWIGLDAILWKSMCQWVIEECTFAPKPAKFKEAHSSCRKNWRDETLAVKKRDCPNCFNSCGFNWIYYRANGKYPYSGIVPCRTCNPDQFVPRSESKIGPRIAEAEWDRMCRDPEPDPAFETRKATAELDRLDRGPSHFKNATEEIKIMVEKKRAQAKAVGPTEDIPF